MRPPPQKDWRQQFSQLTIQITASNLQIPCNYRFGAMTLSVSLELSENDVKHFRLIMREARKAVANIPAEDIIEAAEQLLLDATAEGNSKFIARQLGKIRVLLDMLQDREWALPEEDSARVLNALAYFAEPEDLIPDHIPGIGLLDDAIMVELVSQDLRVEIETYQEFVEFRNSRQPEDTSSRDEWLNQKRRELHTKISAGRRKNK